MSSYAEAAHKANNQHNSQPPHSARSSTPNRTPAQPPTSQKHNTQCTSSRSRALSQPPPTQPTSNTTERGTELVKSRTAYIATGFKGANYDRIEIDGTIHNHAAPAHVTSLEQKFKDGLITAEQYTQMYRDLLRADAENVSEIRATIVNGGTGKVFKSKGIMNDLSLAPTKTDQFSKEHYEKEMQNVQSSIEQVDEMERRGLLQPKAAEKRRNQLQDKMDELVGKYMGLD